jgi:AbrB family looped-hinge helix DNA binding protein
MEHTRLSTKGQVILPKAIRRSRQWKPGQELIVEESNNGVLLRAAKPFPAGRIEELLGCTGYKGRRKSLQDMQRAIAKGAKSAS